MKGRCRLKKCLSTTLWQKSLLHIWSAQLLLVILLKTMTFPFLFFKQCKCCQQGQAQLCLLLSNICIWNWLVVLFLRFGHGARCPWGPDLANGCIMTIKEHHDISRVNIRYLKNFQLWNSQMIPGGRWFLFLKNWMAKQK